MKKKGTKRRAASKVDFDEVLPEYDFSRGRSNKFAPRYTARSVAVVLDPDVAAVFPTAKQANDALRSLAGIIGRHDRAKRA